jgi:hypothetical protein
MANVESIEPHLAPIRKSVLVRRTPAEAFEIFTAGMARWWPRERFSLYQAESRACIVEPRVGGRIYEVSNQGEQGDWGAVTCWEPPDRFAMTWHPGTDSATPTDVEVRFVAVPEGTRVELEHRNWFRLGDRAKSAREAYENGWPHVFETCFVEACA